MQFKNGCRAPLKRKERHEEILAKSFNVILIPLMGLVAFNPLPP